MQNRFLHMEIRFCHVQIHFFHMEIRFFHVQICFFHMEIRFFLARGLVHGGGTFSLPMGTVSVYL